MFKHRMLWITLLLSLFATQSILTAQNPIIITVTAPEYQADLYEDTIIPQFEAEHPNILVEFVYSDNTYFGNPLYESEDSEEPTFYDKLNDYVSSADVLYVHSSSLSSYATQTGFFLDLSPLVNVDNSLQVDDFYHAAWQSFQWDGGHWALPYSLQLQLLVYNQDMFDDAGFAYPDETWQMQDYIRAAEAMHTYNDEGQVELSPLRAIDPIRLFHNRIGTLYDDMTLPAEPDFSNPALIEILDAYMTYQSAYEFEESNGYSFNEVPMSLSYPYQLSSSSFGSDGDVNWGVSFLPGNVATSYTEGFAISRGTLYPEAAYEFASFMTRNIDVFQYSFGSSSARRSLIDAEPDGEDVFYSQPEFEPEVEALLNQALDLAIPPNNLRYSEVFYRARTLIETEDMTIEDALETIELEILDVLEKSTEQQSAQIIVAAPELRPDLAPDEIMLNFGLNISGNISENQHLWDDLIDEFVASHPRVGDIDIDTQIYGPDGLDEEIDCWYNSFGSSFSYLTEPPEDLLALDPFLSADPSFDMTDFIPGILDGARVQNLTYGYPLTVQPLMMRLNLDKFEDANLPIPDSRWTVNEFTNTLVALGETREDKDQVILRSNIFGSSWIVMLLGSYGGQPFDYSTDPPTYRLTDPQTILAVEQLSRYMQDGLIGYSSQISNNSGFFGGSIEDEYIIIDLLGNTGFGPIENNDDVRTKVVMFPEGEYMPVAFSSGMAHISSATVYIQECYDWIQAVATHPELFSGMPSRYSQFENPALIAEEGIEIVDFYRSMTDGLNAPNVMALPNVYGGVPSTKQGAWIAPDFFFYALDNIILNEGDLEDELAQAQENTELYNQCTDNIDQISPNELGDLFSNDQAAGQKYLSQFSDCAITLVPEMRERYSFYYQD